MKNAKLALILSVLVVCITSIVVMQASSTPVIVAPKALQATGDYDFPGIDFPSIPKVPNVPAFPKFPQFPWPWRPEPTPTPVPTVTPEPTITPTLTPTPIPVTPTPTVVPVTPTPTVVPTLTPTPVPVTPTPTVVPVTPTPTPMPVTPTPTVVPTLTPTPTPIPVTPTPTVTPTPGDGVMAPVDSALATGPVLLEFYTAGCSYCQQQKPILEQLQTEYSGTATIMQVDANANTQLAQAFSVNVVPTMSVIVIKNADGSYAYSAPDGSISTDRVNSRFVGFTEKSVLTAALDAALSAR